MKIKDIARMRSDIDSLELEQFLNRSGKYRPFVKTSMFASTLDDKVNVDSVLEDFLNYKEEQKKQAEKEQWEKEENERLKKEVERKYAEAALEIEQKKREAEQQKRMALAKMLISSGFSFEGYRIVKYSGYISGDDAIEISRGTAGLFSNPTNVGNSLMASLAKLRQHALAELKEAAYALGCNAVIGVDFDYITLEPETANSTGGTTYLPYVFGVTANGNAVIIEKIDDENE